MCMSVGFTILTNTSCHSCSNYVEVFGIVEVPYLIAVYLLMHVIFYIMYKNIESIGYVFTPSRVLCGLHDKVLYDWLQFFISMCAYILYAIWV